MRQCGQLDACYPATLAGRHAQKPPRRRQNYMGITLGECHADSETDSSIPATSAKPMTTAQEQARPHPTTPNCRLFVDLI